jgi:hypothetical protein
MYNVNPGHISSIHPDITRIFMEPAANIEQDLRLDLFSQFDSSFLG